MDEKVLVLGQGGREHALCWKFSQSTHVGKVWVYPGNVGMLKTNKVEIAPLSSMKEVVSFCQKETIDLVVIGPEDLIAKGFGERLREAGIQCIAPSAKNARLESSKIFAKKTMRDSKIPTAPFLELSNREELKFYVERMGENDPIVLKYDGLAQGKGVIVCMNRTEAIVAVEEFEDKEIDGPFLAEKFLEGREISLFALCRGSKFLPLGAACDYKRLKEGNLGPNTGGMGTYTPAPWIEEDELSELYELTISRLLRTLEKKGSSYHGFLFAGIMMTKDGPQVLEYNIRLGDPETQVLLPRIENDLYELLKWSLGHESKKPQVTWRDKAYVHVVLASEGYPYKSEVHRKIEMPKSQNPLTFFAAVTREGDDLLSYGGRVLGVTGEGTGHEEAREQAYESMGKIALEGGQYRRDIAIL